MKTMIEKYRKKLKKKKSMQIFDVFFPEKL